MFPNFYIFVRLRCLALANTARELLVLMIRNTESPNAIYRRVYGIIAIFLTIIIFIIIISIEATVL